MRHEFKKKLGTDLYSKVVIQRQGEKDRQRDSERNGNKYIKILEIKGSTTLSSMKYFKSYKSYETKLSRYQIFEDTIKTICLCQNRSRHKKVLLIPDVRTPIPPVSTQLLKAGLHRTRISPLTFVLYLKFEGGFFCNL